MLVEEFSELSDVALDESSEEEHSDDIYPQSYYGMEASDFRLLSQASLLKIENAAAAASVENLLQNPSPSDVFYFEQSKELLVNGSLPRKYSVMFLQRAFGIVVNEGESSQLEQIVEARLDEKYESLSKTTGFCRKYLKKSMGFGYVCVECMSHNKNSFVCADCFNSIIHGSYGWVGFKHSNHQGHRVIKLASSGVCDCGDFDIQRYPNANCSKHRGDIPVDDITSQEEKDHFKRELQSFLLVQFSILKTLDFTLKSTIGDVVVKELFLGLKHLTEKHPALVSLVAHSLLQPLTNLESFLPLNIQNLLEAKPPESLIRHPTNVKLTAQDAEKKEGDTQVGNAASVQPVESKAEPPAEVQPTIKVSSPNLMQDEQELARAKPEEEIGAAEATPTSSTVFSSLDLLFYECMQLHVSQAKELVELLVHFSTVPQFKSEASVSWVLNLPRLFSPGLLGEDFDGSDKFICPLFDLCDQFLVDGKSLQELFKRSPPLHWIHLMAHIWEKTLKISDTQVVQFLDKRLWEDFLIDVLDSILANKSWNAVLLQKEEFVKALIRFFVNCYHCSLSLPITRPDDDTVTLISYVAHQAMDFQATCLTFFGKIVSRLLLHPREHSLNVISIFKKILQDELMQYRNFRCGVLVPKAGMDLSLFRLLTLLCCVIFTLSI